MYFKIKHIPPLIEKGRGLCDCQSSQAVTKIIDSVLWRGGGGVTWGLRVTVNLWMRSKPVWMIYSPVDRVSGCQCQSRNNSADAVAQLVLSWSVYWPNRLGWRLTVLQPPSTFMLLSWWCPLGHDTCRQYSLSLPFDWYQFWPTTLVPAGQYF